MGKKFPMEGGHGYLSLRPQGDILAIRRNADFYVATDAIFFWGGNDHCATCDLFTLLRPLIDGRQK